VMDVEMDGGWEEVEARGFTPRKPSLDVMM
jgi:hypothetical protein